MRGYWRISIRQAVLYSIIGCLLSLLIAIGIIWHIPTLGKRSYAVYLPNIFPSTTETDWRSYPLKTKSLGISARIWWEVDEHWPWKDSVPENIDAVGGVWAGLPFTAIHRRVDYPPDPILPNSIRLHPSYLTTWNLHYDWRLYRPYWIGLIANTLFWGGLLWLCRGGVRMFRGNRWERRGCCGMCGYSRDGHEESVICPECGSIFNKRSTKFSR